MNHGPRCKEYHPEKWYDPIMSLFGKEKGGKACLP
jgi:hypothetical protein